MAQIQYFLGGNTPTGFYSLYDQLSDLHKISSLYILKGGAGCGKSTLMRRIARHGEAAGFQAEQILCSGDPDSLDGVVFPALSAALVDGTAPHVMEARYAGAAERYVDLSRFYDRKALIRLRDDIVASTAAYKERRREAYRRLEAAGQLIRDRTESVCTDKVRAMLDKRARGIIRRELKSRGGKGSVSRQFLTALTHRGAVALWDTVQTQADRVYRMTDSSGMAHHLLTPIANAATDGGWDTVICPDPMDPRRTAHLLIPELRLAFVTNSPLFPFPEKTYRHLRLDAMADRELSPVLRSRLRLSGRITDALLEDAVAALAAAKEEHDRLEELYNPHVDFDGVCRQADELARELFG